MNDLLTAHNALLNAFAAHDRLALAQALVCFDPCRYLMHDPDDHFYDDMWDLPLDDAILYALMITRRTWPDLHARTLAHIHQNKPLTQVSDFIIEQFAAKWPFLRGTSIQELPQGPLHQMPFVGTELMNPADGDEHQRFMETNPELAELLVQVFDVKLEEGDPHSFGMDSLSAANTIAAQLTRELFKRHDPILTALGNLLEYIFGDTGNELADLSIYGFYEMGFTPLDWTPDDLDTAQDAVDHLNNILKDCERAKAALKSDPALKAALKNNIHLIRSAYQEAGFDLAQLADWRFAFNQAEETRRKISDALDNIAFEWPRHTNHT